MKSVGIDIGSSSIKIIEAHQTKRGVILANFQEHRLGQSPAFDSSLEILEFLSQVSQQYQSETWKIVVALRQEFVSARTKIFPFNDRIKILKSLPFELEEELPFSVDNAIYDGKIIQLMGNSAQVLACAAPKSRIAETLEKIRETGMTASILSAEAVALANCWENWNEAPPNQPNTQFEIGGEQKPEKPIRLLLSLGHTRTLVCAFDGTSLIAVRSILWGGKNLAESLMLKYEIPFVEALNVVQTKAFILLNQENASYDQIIFSQAIGDSFKELGRELQMTLLELQSEFNTKVKEISITGGLSQIPNLHAFLTQQLEVSVNQVQILSKQFNISFQTSTAIDASCGVAVGLAIEGLKKPRNPAINFLKNEFQIQHQKFVQAWQKWGTLSKSIAVIFAIFVIHSTVRDYFANQLLEKSSETVKIQAKETAHLPTKQRNENGIRKYLKEQRKKSQEIKDVQNIAKLNSTMEVLQKISDAVPGKNSIALTISKIEIHGQQVSLSGQVSRTQDVATLQKSLSHLASGKIESRIGTAASNGSVAFALSFNIDRGITLK